MIFYSLTAASFPQNKRIWTKEVKIEFAPQLLWEKG